MSDSEPGAGDPAAARRFATTHWSLVAAARDRPSSDAADALARLCASYWYPIYCFIRRQGHSVDDAQDLTQGFFTRFLEKNFLESVDRGKGRFRSFLLAACRHFLSNERDRARASKRGSGRIPVSIDSVLAERRYGRDISHTLTPELMFERQWAVALLEKVLARLRDEFEAAGRGHVFARLKGFLTGEEEPDAYRQAAQDLGVSEGAVRVAIHRLRRRYREELWRQLGDTVEEPEQVRDEIRHLLTVLGRPGDAV